MTGSPATPPLIKIDGRTKKNGKPLDLKQVFKLKSQGLSKTEISRVVGYSKGYISRVIDEFTKLIKHPDIIDTYENNRTDLLSSIELELLANLGDEEKLKSASLNNVAYAMTQTSQLRRLESGQSTANIGIAIESKLAKALEKAHGTDETSSSEATD